MINKKYQVFISSTYLDLVQERNSVLESLIELGHIPVGMELFPASNSNQWYVIQKIINECDYYILIIGDRYGSIGKDGISYTEMEYDYASSRGIPILTFIKKRSNDENSQVDDKIKLSEFKSKTENKLVKYFTDNFDLKSKVTVSLIEIFKNEPRPGYMRMSSHSEGLPTIEDIISSQIAKYFDSYIFSFFRNGREIFNKETNDGYLYSIMLYAYGGALKIFIETFYCWKNEDELNDITINYGLNKLFKLSESNHKNNKDKNTRIKIIAIFILGDGPEIGFGFDKVKAERRVDEFLDNNHFRNFKATYIKYSEVTKLPALWFQSLLDEKAIYDL